MAQSEETTKTEIKKVDPFKVGVSEFNERKEDNLGIETGDGPSLGNSVNEIGIVEPPKVRELPEDEKDPFEYEVIVGQRRVNAAQSANIEEISVIVGNWDDKEALVMSISENIDAFKEKVSATDRGNALQKLWELMPGTDEDDFPSSSPLARELGVPIQTVSTWLETLRPEWDGTEIEAPVKKTDSSDCHNVPDDIADKLGERKLLEIRNATGGGEEGEKVAKRVLEKDLNRDEVKKLRKYLEEDVELDTAIKHVTGDYETEEPETEDRPHTWQEALGRVEDDEDGSEEDNTSNEEEPESEDDNDLTGTFPVTIHFPKELQEPLNDATDGDSRNFRELIVGIVDEWLQEEGYK